MFTVKNAIMEILNKSKSLDEVLAVLNTEDKATLLATFDLMKAKLGGSMDVMDTQDNGQWSLAKNTLDYSKINEPKSKPSKEPARTIDYNSPDFKSLADKPKPWAGSVARRDKMRAKIQRESDAKKSEDPLQQIKDQYADKQPKPLDEEVAEVKERHMPKPPKSDEEKANEAKKKFRQESKLKAEEPFNNSIKASRRQQQSE